MKQSEIYKLLKLLFFNSQKVTSNLTKLIYLIFTYNCAIISAEI